MRTPVNHNIHFAPLQGATDALFRFLFEKHFDGIHLFYTPYLQLENDGGIKRSKFRDVEEDKLREKTVVQILPKNLEEFHRLADEVSDLGYTGVNVNMGCPYPMVRNRGRGAGLLNHSDILVEIIDEGVARFGDRFSIKARTGIENHNQFNDALERTRSLDQLKVILHPRTAVQLYKGKASVNNFAELVDKYPEIQWIYNGDIDSASFFDQLAPRFHHIDGWMIGRGLLKNPFLAEQICGIANTMEPIDRIYKFLNEYIEQCLIESNDVGHALNRISQFSIYFSHWFEKQSKVAKIFKKAKNFKDIDKCRFQLQLDHRVLNHEIVRGWE